MFEPTKKDWKLYREKIPKWQEHYMEKLIKQYSELLFGDLPALTKFWRDFSDEVQDAVKSISERL